MKKNYKIRITIKTKRGLGLHQGPFKLQTMTALIKSFYGCYTGPDVSRERFFQKESPLAAGGKE